VDDSQTAYASWDHLQIEGEISTEVPGGYGDTASAEASFPKRSFKLYYQRPALLAVRFDQDTGPTTIIDGKRVYVALPRSPVVLRAPAPASVAEALASPGVRMALGNESLAYVAAFVSGARVAPSGTEVRSGLDHRNQWLVSLDQPNDTQAVTLRPTEGPAEVMWYNRHDHLLRRMAIDGGLIRVTITLNKNNPDDEIPAQVFRYRPGPGVRIVDVPLSKLAETLRRELKPTAPAPGPRPSAEERPPSVSSFGEPSTLPLSSVP
jgi:outer membrane lipoprotein-sorting protein